jgi:hypothetical protein
LAGENPDSSNGVHEFGTNTSGSFITGAPVGQARGYGAPSRHMATTVLEVVGTFLILAGIAVGILTLRFALVLIHGVIH